uniref:Uncharacterized protein n=1 Tax=Plectus sambesii TaxID=2011161 RepID=A0A914UQ69_9BILA
MAARASRRGHQPCQSAGAGVFVAADHGIIRHSATRAISGARTLRQATPSSVWFVCSASVSSDRPVQIKGLAIARVELDPSPLVRPHHIVLSRPTARSHCTNCTIARRRPKTLLRHPSQQCALNGAVSARKTPAAPFDHAHGWQICGIKRRNRSAAIREKWTRVGPVARSADSRPLVIGHAVDMRSAERGHNRGRGGSVRRAHTVHRSAGNDDKEVDAAAAAAAAQTDGFTAFIHSASTKSEDAQGRHVAAVDGHSASRHPPTQPIIPHVADRKNRPFLGRRRRRREKDMNAFLHGCGCTARPARINMLRQSRRRIGRRRAAISSDRRRRQRRRVRDLSSRVQLPRP